MERLIILLFLLMTVSSFSQNAILVASDWNSIQYLPFVKYQLNSIGVDSIDIVYDPDFKTVESKIPYRKLQDINKRYYSLLKYHEYDYIIVFYNNFEIDERFDVIGKNPVNTNICFIDLKQIWDRLKDYGYNATLTYMKKVLIHEIGHIIGQSHCNDISCTLFNVCTPYTELCKFHKKAYQNNGLFYKKIVSLTYENRKN